MAIAELCFFQPGLCRISEASWEIWRHFFQKSIFKVTFWCWRSRCFAATTWKRWWEPRRPNWDCFYWKMTTSMSGTNGLGTCGFNYRWWMLDFNHPNDASSIRGCMKNFKLSKRTPRLLTLTSQRIDPVRPNVLSSGHESCLLGGLRSWLIFCGFNEHFGTFDASLLLLQNWFDFTNIGLLERLWRTWC